MDAVLNEAARSTGLELDRVCDGCDGGMLGGLTQMPPPPLERARHTRFDQQQMLDEPLSSRADGVPDCSPGQAPPLDRSRDTPRQQTAAAGSQTLLVGLPLAGQDSSADVRTQPPATDESCGAGGVAMDGAQPSQAEIRLPGSLQCQSMGSPCHSDGGELGILTQRPQRSPADSPRHTPREEWLQDSSPCREPQQESPDCSSREDLAESGPQHPPQGDWSQECHVNSRHVPQQSSLHKSLPKASAAKPQISPVQLPPAEQPHDSCAAADALQADGAAPAPARSSSPGQITISSSLDETGPQGSSSCNAGAAQTRTGLTIRQNWSIMQVHDLVGCHTWPTTIAVSNGDGAH